MTIATWNVNSIRARKDRLFAWLEAKKPDVVCLQELKLVDAEFPSLELLAAGYHSVAECQPTYNGVAILSRSPPADMTRGLGDGVDDPQARLIAATVDGVRVICAYVPNGQEVGSPKWAYKLEWMQRLRSYLGRECDPAQPLALCGDMNVAPEPVDVHDPALWEGTTLFHPAVRAALGTWMDWGLADVYRRRHAEAGRYSWWDYRMLAFPRNLGLRIDLVLATAPLAARCVDAEIDRDQRKGVKPSDHAPVVASFEL